MIQIALSSNADGFAEDKEQARVLRVEKILPALARGEKLVFDFGLVRYATQSYVHALIGEALKKYGDRVLDDVEFKNCSKSVRSVIELVVDYSLDGFAESRAV